MKHCSFCGEEILASAIKCKHCGSMIDDQLSSTIIQAFSSKYKLLEEIGRGGTSNVYKAIHKDTNKVVALKILHPFLTHDKENLERFHRESKSIKKLIKVYFVWLVAMSKTSKYF